jgi:multiple sugar transport system permease protein
MRLTMTPYAFLAPALVVTAAVILFPVLQTGWMSLHDYVLFRPRDVPFVGLGNFVRAFNDPVFWVSLWNSVLWIGLVISFQFALGLGAALLLNQSFWWRGIARALIVIPWALPSVIIGLMWTWMYDFNLGILNDVL